MFENLDKVNDKEAEPSSSQSARLLREEANPELVANPASRNSAVEKEVSDSAKNSSSSSSSTPEPIERTNPYTVTQKSGERSAIQSNEPEKLRVLTFNIAVDGRYGLDGVINLIRNSNADVIGLQEVEHNTAKIAEALGYKYYNNGYGAILTRLEIERVTPGGSGIVARTEGGQQVAFFNRHLYYKPYQPYQLLGIPYEDSKFIKTEAEAIEEAKKARGQGVEDLRKDIDSLKDLGLPTIVVGDFNEPSHLDWTDAAAKAGLHPIKVEWPASKALADDGFHDAYRKIHPDEIVRPGYTWTPTTKPDDKLDHHDRIDFILFRGDGIKPNSVEIIGEDPEVADVVVTPFPSDHRAVAAEFQIDRRSNATK